MRQLISTCTAAAALILLGACGASTDEAASDANAAQPAPSGDQMKARPGMPPMPLYQMRDTLPEGDRTEADIADGAAIFSNRCGSCHLPGGMGTNLLTKQQVEMGNAPEMGLLTNRTDLTSDYVKYVVRHGKMAMPRLPKVEATDAELEAIAAYLGKADQ